MFKKKKEKEDSFNGLFWFATSSSIHILVSYNKEWRQSREHGGWILLVKKAKV